MGCVTSKRDFVITSSIINNEDIVQINESNNIEKKIPRSSKSYQDSLKLKHISIRKMSIQDNNFFVKKSRTKSYSTLIALRKRYKNELDKVESFEKKMNNKTMWNINNATIFENYNKSQIENVVKNFIEETKFIHDNENNITDIKNNNVELKNKELNQNNSNLENIPNNNEEDNSDDDFFIENTNSIVNYSASDNILNFMNTKNLNENSENKLLKGKLFQSTSEICKNNKKYSCLTETTGVTQSQTMDYSVIEDLEKLSKISSSKILKKFNLNPYHNFNVVKKYFIYQLQKGFLQAKKFVINNEIHGENNPDNSIIKNPNYHEIFSNYSQITTCEVSDYIKYEDKNVKINNYFINKNKVLGKGGFSTVYLCKSLKDEREYAVKITDKKVKANARKTKYDYVKDEVNILKRLYSRYIVRTYEILETKTECLIFMELMKNNSLFSKISKLDDFKIWKYFRNLICGVEHCHEIAKIIHRDINVNNLLISDDDILKLSDFGVSVNIENNDDLISVNSGPTTYTPPEKKSNEFTHYHGKQADIWCCGVALYHMIYKKPFPVEKQEYKIKLPENPYDPIDPILKELLLNLLDTDPFVRYTFNEMKKNSWITKNGEFPLPDIHEEALEYVYSLTTLEIKGIKSGL